MRPASAGEPERPSLLRLDLGREGRAAPAAETVARPGRLAALLARPRGDLGARGSAAPGADVPQDGLAAARARDSRRRRAARGAEARSLRQGLLAARAGDGVGEDPRHGAARARPGRARVALQTLLCGLTDRGQRFARPGEPAPLGGLEGRDRGRLDERKSVERRGGGARGEVVGEGVGSLPWAREVLDEGRYQEGVRELGLLDRVELAARGDLRTQLREAIADRGGGPATSVRVVAAEERDERPGLGARVDPRARVAGEGARVGRRPRRGARDRAEEPEVLGPGTLARRREGALHGGFLARSVLREARRSRDREDEAEATRPGLLRRGQLERRRERRGPIQGGAEVVSLEELEDPVRRGGDRRLVLCPRSGREDENENENENGPHRNSDAILSATATPRPERRTLSASCSRRPSWRSRSISSR